MPNSMSVCPKCGVSPLSWFKCECDKSLKETFKQPKLKVDISLNKEQLKMLYALLEIDTQYMSFSSRRENYTDIVKQVQEALRWISAK